MTVNITINADTLEITQVDDMTRIVCGGEDKKDKPESESDWIVRRKLKPQRLGEAAILEQGLYFRREVGSDAWLPWVYDYWEGIHYMNETELLGPITPDMFL